MKWDIYYRSREYAHELGDPLLSTVEAPSKEEAERLALDLGFGQEGGTWAVPMRTPRGWLPNLAYASKTISPPVIPRPDHYVECWVCCPLDTLERAEEHEIEGGLSVLLGRHPECHPDQP